MRRLFRFFAVAVTTACLICAEAHPSAFAQRQAGPVVAVGGGGTTDALVRATIALAGGSTAVVAVLPQAGRAGRRRLPVNPWPAVT